MKLNCIVAALVACGSVTGCDAPCPPTIKPSITHTDNHGGAPDSTTYRIEAEFKSCPARVFGVAALRSTALDVSNIAIDITGQGTAILDGSGTGTLLLTQEGTVIGSTTFNYIVMDSMAVVADPATVNNWLTEHPSADGYDVKLHDIPTVDVVPGTATLTVDAYYGSTEISSSSTSWTSGAGNGCIPGGNHGNPGGVQPIELPGDGGGACP